MIKLSEAPSTDQPTSLRNIHDLSKSIQDSYEKLEPFRRNAKEFVEEWLGNRYSDETKLQHRGHINQLAQAIETFTIHMVPQRPVVNITTDFTEYKPTAESLKLAVNNEFSNMNIESTLEAIVVNAYIRMGIAKIGITEGNYKRIENQTIDIGRLFVANVSIENWVHDMSGTELDRCEFYGDRYTISTREMMAMPMYDPKVHRPTRPGDSTYDSYDSRIKHLEKAPTYETNAAADQKVEVWDIWLTSTNEVVTFIADSSNDTDTTYPLKIVKWKGPKEGPYKLLRFNPVPECVLPAAIGPNLVDLHIDTNNLFRKQLDQAKRKKEVMAYKLGNEVDAEKVRDAHDQEMVGMKDPTNVNPMKFGEMDQHLNMFLMQVDQFFDRQAGNLSLLSGTGASSGTVGQEQLLQSNSTSRINLFKGKVRGFVRDIAKDIAWWVWNNPNYNPPLFKEIPNTDIKVPATLDRMGEFIDYNFDIEPHSIEYNPPEQKMSKLMGILNQLMPALQLMMQQGVSIDFKKLIEIFSDYAGLPELKDMMQFASPPEEGLPMSKEGNPGMPQHTTREYNHKRTSEQTPDGFRKSMMQLMAGAGKEQSLPNG